MIAEEETWVAGERRLPLFASGANATEAQPRADARAQQLCRGFAVTTRFRFVDSGAVGAFGCEDGVCRLSGEAVCKLEERQPVTHETCGAE